MKELVFKSEKGNSVTTSLLVAEKFKKRHSDVLRAIDNLNCSPEFRKRNFAFVEYQGLGAMRGRTCYMNKDGFAFLAMGFTGMDAGRFKEDYINAFNKMEQTIINGGFFVPTSFREALLLAAEQQEVIEAQLRTISAQAPKALFADAVATSTQSCLIGELAKILRQNGIEIGQNRLFTWLRHNGYLCQSGERYNQPTQMAMDMQLFEIKKTTINKPDGSILVSATTKATGKGQIYFVNKFLKQVPA